MAPPVESLMTTEWDDDVTLIPKLPYVVSETLHGEAIIMHHGTGHYFL